MNERDAKGNWPESMIAYDWHECQSVDDLYRLYERDGFLSQNDASDAMAYEIARGFCSLFNCGAVSPRIEMWHCTSEQINDAWHVGLGRGWEFIIIPLDQFETPEAAIRAREKGKYEMFRHEFVDPYIKFAIEDGKITV